MGRKLFKGMESVPPRLDLVEQLDGLVGGQRDDRPLPVGAASLRAAEALDLAVHRLRAHVLDLDLEDGLDGTLDLDLVRFGVDLEGVLVRLLAQDRSLLRDQRPLDHLPSILHRANTSVRRSRPDFVNTTVSQSSNA